MENQEKLWDKIAPEWNEYKQKPSENAIEFLKKTKGNILDLGSGSGRHLTKIKNGKMFLQDFSEEMLNLAKKKAKLKKIEAKYLKSPLNKIPKPDKFFDYAICVSAIHCVETAEERLDSIKELYRVLKKGGEAYVGVWNAKSKRFMDKSKEKMVGWGDLGKRYYYLYYEEEIHKLFKEIGFEIVSTQNSEMMINFIARKI
ncbi:class I SAM-dependent methyltransferase [archaeon]|nr:class I SAM-dependent methyltransferase [archaeon]PJC45578.1 MAG: hypothetical protein CO037_00810 [Candidatus Pacearchaeota archaeon CG_4_9_14_0_2_um_filter_30_8]